MFLRQKSQQTHYDVRIATKLAKTSKSIVITLIQYRNEKKTLLQENFDLMINFDFFWPNKFRVAHGISVKFGLWTFHKLLKRWKNFDLVDFWLPYLWLVHIPDMVGVMEESQEKAIALLMCVV